jgi:hypothetical protein
MSYTHKNTRARARAHTHAHTHARARTRTHAHTHARARTHPHPTPPPPRMHTSVHSLTDYCAISWLTPKLMFMKNCTSNNIYPYFHLYSCYIEVYICFLVKFCTFGFILKTYATIATDMHFSSKYVTTKICLTHTHTLYAVLTGVRCLEMKHDHRT